MKTVKHKGFKFNLPDKVSMNTFKEVVSICGGYIDVIQPMLNLIGRKLEGTRSTTYDD